jgi:integrase
MLHYGTICCLAVESRHRFTDNQSSKLGSKVTIMEPRTVNEMLDRFEREHLPTLRQNTIDDYKRLIRNLRRAFGEMVASAVTRKDIAKFMDVRTGKIGRNKLVSALSSAYKEALKWGWVDSNPCMYVERHESEPSDRQLTDEEFNAFKEFVLSDRAGGRMSITMDLARQTGQLQQAILGLRWSQVNERKGVIQFRQDATGKKTAVVITPEIRVSLGQAKKLCAHDEFVVISRKGKRYSGPGFRAIWQRRMRKFEKTGIDKFDFHDIKRLFLEDEKARKAVEGDDVVSKIPQFHVALLVESEQMAKHYRVFYCLEKSIREFVTSAMEHAYGPEWWDNKVDPKIRQEIDVNMAKEIDSGITQRSQFKIDYTTFGQLCRIITQNWDAFNKKLKSPGAVTTVTGNLNRLRGSIAHFSPMSDHEAARLALTVKDWFNNVLI